MMKYASFILMLLLVSACKKDDSPAAADGGKLPGSYTKNGMTYGIYSHSLGGCTPNNYDVFSVADYGWDEPARYLRMSFSESPVVGKSYRVGDYKYSTSYPPNGEVYVEAGQLNSLDIYASDGDGQVLATVSLENGKRVITIPEFTAQNRYDVQQPKIKISVRGVMVEY